MQETLSMLPENATKESSPIDIQELVDRCMGNLELAQRVFAKLQSQFKDDLIDLELALAAKDSKLMACIAHRLKGAASNVAAHNLYRSVASLEESAREGQIANLPAQLDILRKELSRLNETTLSGTKTNCTINVQH
jgi:HPt (histidine-containing phosphotransfer) domain-containing protein